MYDGDSQRPELSIVLPIFNEEAVVDELHRRLGEFFATIGTTWEVVFVNDGSSDSSYDKLKELCSRERRYRLVSFSRNFGHQLAITAGLDYAHGNAVVVMDADLQDPPEVVVEMLARFREGFDVVHAVRRKRERESIFKRATAYAYYRMLRAMVGIAIPLDAGDFRLMSRRVVLTMRALGERSRFVRGMVAWVGFRQVTIDYDRKARFAGETHYPLRKMLKFAVDGMTAFSTVPLRSAIWLGILAGFIAIGVAVFSLLGSLWGHAVPGWATVMITVSLGASAQLIMTGILGEYVGRIYEEVKRRPLYIVAEEVNATRDATQQALSDSPRSIPPDRSESKSRPQHRST
jgi:dolichol-phosphate mannosyltransferase